VRKELKDFLARTTGNIPTCTLMVGFESGIVVPA